MNQLNPATEESITNKLSEATRLLAIAGLSGEWGRTMKEAPEELASHLPDTEDADLKKGGAVRLIAENAPLELREGCRVVGSAPYGEAAFHQVPILRWHSTSHTTIGFEPVLHNGYRWLRERLEERLSRGDTDEKQTNFLKGMQTCLDAAGTWQKRYIEKLQSLNDPHWNEVLSYSRNVPENPPASFKEAVQSLWWMWGFQRLVGNWSGVGRIDKILGPYLKADLEKGVIDIEQAREMLAHFWILGTEWTGFESNHVKSGTGDAQFYQNVVLSGCDEKGNDITNEVTYLVLDIVEELHISDFPVAVRINEKTDEKLLRRIAEVSRLGGGIVSVYNDSVVLPGLDRLGIPKEEARDYANDGCWEVLIPGKTAFGYRPFDILSILQQTLCIREGEIPEFKDFGSLFQAFADKLQKHLDEVIHPDVDGSHSGGYGKPAISLFVEDCIERARGYSDRGARYSIRSPHAGGMADTANSLAVIKKLVYENKEMTLKEFVTILRHNWKGNESLKQKIRKEFNFYGNDTEEIDEIMVRLFDTFTDMVWKEVDRDGMLRPPGISTFGREINWRGQRTASPHGFGEGEMLATNFSPTPGTEKKGPTAVVKSYCAVDFTKLPNGGTLEIKLHPSSTKGDEGIEALAGLLKTFVELGGFYLNIDVMDADLLRDAQKHPEKYPNLAVRISGWCARFHTLSKDWQDMVIGKLSH